MQNVLSHFSCSCPKLPKKTCFVSTRLPSVTKVPRSVLFSNQSCSFLQPRIHRKGVKSKATFTLRDLPQRAFEVDDAASKTEGIVPAYPMMIQQARNNMEKFEGCVLLTRVGSFYELYFEHAESYGPLLNLKVARKKTSAGWVSMAGFPFFQLDRFLKILVQDLSKFVAISEEFANNASNKVKSGGLMFDRKVIRVVTPGTLIDEKFMDPYENNFLLAIYPSHKESSPKMLEEASIDSQNGTSKLFHPLKAVGLAWLDLSTGDFFTQSVDLSTLSSALARIGAREIVLSDDAKFHYQNITPILKEERCFVTYHPFRTQDWSISKWAPMLETNLSLEDESVFCNEEIDAGSLLLAYVTEKLQGLGLKLQAPVRRQDNENMRIDKNSLRSLEVLETSKEGSKGAKGSLLHSMRRTVTKSGARLLKDWIASPSMSLNTINARLDLVTYFRDDNALRERITALLKRSYDSQRLVQKFSMGRGDPDDLISLLRTIEATNEVARTLKERIPFPGVSKPATDKDLAPFQALLNLSRRFSLDEPNLLALRISETIDEEGLTQSRRLEEYESADMVSLARGVLLDEGSINDQGALSRITKSKAISKAPGEQEPEDEETWMMRKSASPVLEKLHQNLAELGQDKLDLSFKLRDELGAQSLSLRWAPGMGHICHIRGTKDVRTSLQTPSTARDVKSTKSTRSFHNPEWSVLGGKIDQLKIQIRAEEQRIFQELRKEAVFNMVKLRRNAVILDELDIACSFAILSQEQGYVRPVLNTGLDHKIVGGRHPTVTLGLEEQGRAFVSNDCLIGEKERIWLITGPNMAGKSTFLRQNALISILAQIGSFVPADHAEIGLVDQLFSRVGSADDLFRDQSTFMVEMLETAAILNQATPRSFVIMDEIGRGTTPEDGIAVGFGCLHHLYHKNRCRTLFATHFHSLADMSKDFENLGCYCTDIKEGPEDSFSYVHRLRSGVNRQSHALKVARLAGIPESAIDIAQQVLGTLDGRTLLPL